MTNSNSIATNFNLTNESTTMTNHDIVSLNDINKSAVLSTMAAELFHNGLSPIVSLITATAYLGATDHIEDIDLFTEFFIEGLEITELEIVGAEHKDELDPEAIMSALTSARFFVGDEVGPRLFEIAALRTEAYKPVPASEGITRRFDYVSGKRVEHISPLFKEAVHALESTEYTVSDDMLSIALQVQAKLGVDNDAEGYVVKGCFAMDSSQSYISEFKGDTRGRMYQAACHGPNGQASDRSRALMDLAGVPTDYDVEQVKHYLIEEVRDMISIPLGEAIKESKELGDVDFIIKHMAINDDHTKDDLVSKPWNFVKFSKLIRALQAGERPYIGVAVGLDAKCSGPQLGALMVGDQKVAAACGFTMEEMDDAYALAITELDKVGFHGLTRSDVKKPYMGIFYGQGAAAFEDITDVTTRVWEVIHNGSSVPVEGQAEAFHKAITASFGAKMTSVRNKIRGYSKVTQGRTKHFMPDGFEVTMNYKQQVNVLGEMMEYDTERFDVRISNNAEAFKFINFQLKTKQVHVGDFARNGFVNMIQATDALLARLIVVNMKRMGAKHIISVHDCFRVNVTEMHILEAAIKQAYMELFGCTKLTQSEDLPMGTDILQLYFQGANRQLIQGEVGSMITQFTSQGTRYLQKINGQYVKGLIYALGQSYYFAK